MTERENLLEPLELTGSVFSIKDKKKFDLAISLLKETISGPIFVGDNIITWNRNLSFLREDFYINYLNRKEIHSDIRSCIWRLYILAYFAELVSSLDGDYLELGVLEGNTVEQLIKKLNFGSLNKEYHLYDLFEWKDHYEHDPHPELKNKNLYEKVCKKFKEYNYIKIIKGNVKDTLKDNLPQKIAFAHIDMNHPEPESIALELILPKLSKHGVIIFDDYGWWSYSAQKKVLDPIAKKYDLQILEFPTGQGILINR
tara:strand:+ start:982 stop:1749 length:768 start_codon:yes stop_codon:yes gene_type:complete